MVQPANKRLVTYAALAADATIAGKVDKGTLTFNVKDYGAVGNGSTDDTTAIQAAADAACAVGGELRFPSGGTYMVNPGVTNASGTSACLISLSGPVSVVICRKATVKVISSTTPFVTVFGAVSSLTDMGGTSYEGGGTIDCNSAARIAAHVVPTNVKPNVGIGRTNKGNGIRVRNLRFTNFDSVWCVAMSSSGPGNLSNVEVSHCQFDNLGTPTAADKHDFSGIYIDAISMQVHHNTFWQGAPGAQTFTTNYGSRTAIELHGSGQNCHHNDTWGMQWGGNLWISYNCWTETDALGNKNSEGMNWHDNHFMHCAVGVNLGGATNAGTNYGLSGVRVHHNTITVNPGIWNVDTGGGLYASGVLIATGFATGAWTGVSIDQNDISITANNTAMNSFTFAVTPSATASLICVVLLGSNTTVVRDMSITNNTLRGSCQDGIHLSAYSYDGLTVTGNKIRNSHLVTGGTGFGIYINTYALVGANNQINNALVAGNRIMDNQTSVESPHGYTAPTESGTIFTDTGSASCYEIFDNTYHNKSGATMSVVQGFTGSPAPLVRATDHAATFAAPSGSWAAGSTITTMTQRNVSSPIPAVWVQSTSGAGNVWQRRPSFSEVVTKTAAYTALTGDVVLADASSGAFIVTLPTVRAAASVTVKNKGASNNVTLSPTSGTIDGAATLVLTPGQVACVVSDATNWFAVT